jgi:hypothetical protein
MVTMVDCWSVDWGLASPSLGVCDVSVAKLAVTKRLADYGHVDSEAPFFNDYVRPDVIDELPCFAMSSPGRSAR